jgi:hypothetical protein
MDPRFVVKPRVALTVGKHTWLPTAKQRHKYWRLMKVQSKDRRISICGTSLLSPLTYHQENRIMPGCLSAGNHIRHRYKEQLKTDGFHSLINLLIFHGRTDLLRLLRGADIGILDMLMLMSLPWLWLLAFGSKTICLSRGVGRDYRKPGSLIN